MSEDLRPMLEKAWLVCWLERTDTLSLMPVRELLELNGIHMRRREPGYVVVAICGSLEKAQEVKRAKRKMVAELRRTNEPMQEVGGEG